MTNNINNNYSPQNTHELYVTSLDIPRLPCDELIERVNRFREHGYISFAGVLVGSWQQSVRQALALHEKAHFHVNNGALVGPYVMSYSVLLPGVMLYSQP